MLRSTATLLAVVVAAAVHCGSSTWNCFQLDFLTCYCYADVDVGAVYDGDVARSYSIRGLCCQRCRDVHDVVAAVVGPTSPSAIAPDQLERHLSLQFPCICVGYSLPW